jgi:glutathione-specific gamma-glutamylcyclotransferase
MVSEARTAPHEAIYRILSVNCYARADDFLYRSEDVNDLPQGVAGTNANSNSNGARHGSAPPPLTERELDASLARTLSALNGGGDVWLFAYGSLVWNPGIDFAERRIGMVHGYHRSLCLWSRSNRGTPQSPGLVLALDRGGSCRGVGYRIAKRDAPAQLHGLWRREMVFGSYRPTWLGMRTDSDVLTALAFVIDRKASGYAGRLGEHEVLEAVWRGTGRYGKCVDYVRQTVAALAAYGIVDARLSRLDRLIASQVGQRMDLAR